jgi:hypothetical protein
MTQTISDQLLEVSKDLKRDYSRRLIDDILSVEPDLQEAKMLFRQMSHDITIDHAAALTEFVQAICLYDPGSPFILQVRNLTKDLTNDDLQQALIHALCYNQASEAFQIMVQH